MQRTASVEFFFGLLGLSTDLGRAAHGINVLQESDKRNKKQKRELPLPSAALCIWASVEAGGLFDRGLA